MLNGEVIILEEKIIDYTIRLIEEKGLKNFTMDEVAKELGISKKTIYKCFNSKTDLMMHVVEKIVAKEKMKIQEATQKVQTKKEKLSAIISNYTSTYFNEKINTEIKTSFPESFAYIEELAEYKKGLSWDYYKQMLKESDAKAGLRKEVFFAILDATIDYIIHQKFEEKYNITAKEALEEFQNIIFYGILTT